MTEGATLSHDLHYFNSVRDTVSCVEECENKLGFDRLAAVHAILKYLDTLPEDV